MKLSQQKLIIKTFKTSLFLNSLFSTVKEQNTILKINIEVTKLTFEILEFDNMHFISSMSFEFKSLASTLNSFI